MSTDQQLSLKILFQPFWEYFEKFPEITELVVNEPEVILLEGPEGWMHHSDGRFTFDYLLKFSVAIAAANQTEHTKQAPILSAALPGEMRVMVVKPPAVPAGRISVTIRRPSSTVKPLSSFAQEGFFDDVFYPMASQDLTLLNPVEMELLGLLSEKNYVTFFDRAVEEHLNIAIVGGTGSGKTTFMKSLVQQINIYERLISIEDVREIFIPQHKNFVNLLYQAEGPVTPSDLIRATMRMKPTRLLPAELRGAEAYDLLKILTSGHGGTITTYHADDTDRAIPRFLFMAKEHPEAANLDPNMIKELLFQTIDVIAHVKAIAISDASGKQIGVKRRMTQIYYDPHRKRELAFG